MANTEFAEKLCQLHNLSEEQKSFCLMRYRDVSNKFTGSIINYDGKPIFITNIREVDSPRKEMYENYVFRTHIEIQGYSIEDSLDYGTIKNYPWFGYKITLPEVKTGWYVVSKYRALTEKFTHYAMYIARNQQRQYVKGILVGTPLQLHAANTVIQEFSIRTGENISPMRYDAPFSDYIRLALLASFKPRQQHEEVPTTFTPESLIHLSKNNAPIVARRLFLFTKHFIMFRNFKIARYRVEENPFRFRVTCSALFEQEIKDMIPFAEFCSDA